MATTDLEKMSETKKNKALQTLWNFKEKHKEFLDRQSEAAVNTVMSVGTGAGLAIVDKVVAMVKKDGTSNIVPRLSNPLLVGLAASAAAYLGVGGKGKSNEQLHTVGDGGLAIGTYLIVKDIDILKPKGASASGASEDAEEIRRNIR